MKYLSQFLIILGISLVGELLQRLIPLPIPASVYGIILLFLAFQFRVLRPAQVKQTAGFLSSLLPLLFVAPTVGIMGSWPLIRGSLIPILLLIAATTILTFWISGRVAQAIAKKEGTSHGDS